MDLEVVKGNNLSSKIAATAHRLKGLPGMCALTRLAYIVTREEWDALIKSAEFYAPWTTENGPGPITELNIAGLAVKTDHRATDSASGEPE